MLRCAWSSRGGIGGAVYFASFPWCVRFVGSNFVRAPKSSFAFEVTGNWVVVTGNGVVFVMLTKWYGAKEIRRDSTVIRMLRFAFYTHAWFL